MSRWSSLFFFVFVVAACQPGRGGGDDDDDDDTGGEGEGEGENCSDPDGDHYGSGDDCLGDDCDQADPALWDQCGQDCEAHPERTGCPCDADGAVGCYTGPEGTQDVGICHGGERTCDDGVWTSCSGQQAPLPDGEQCNELDDDCNGRTDEGALNVCGTCGDAAEDCEGISIGPDYGQPFCDDELEDCDGVQETPEGYLTLGETEVSLTNIWIANSSEGTVSKLDTRSGDEIGRFYTGISDDQADPSRTAVDVDGSVYVANRAFYPPARTNATASVTKIAAHEIDCDDQDGDGTISTSTSSVPLPRDTDECVLWTVPVGNPGCGARAMAVDVEQGLDGTFDSKVYVGCFYDREIHKLDGDDGAIDDSFSVADVSPYGFAITGDKLLYVAGLTVDYLGGSNRVGIVDLNQNPPAVRYADPPACGAGGLFGEGGINTYGIAADDRGRLWSCNLWYHCVYRYDPEANQWDVEEAPACRGIAADGEGYMWSGEEATLIRWDPDQMTQVDSVSTSGSGGLGVAVDFDGKIWMVNEGSSDASRVDPNTMSEDGRFSTGTRPYTYSDMTGYQLRNITAPSGRYARTFELCDDADSEWSGIGLDVDLPPGTSVSVRVRTGATVEELEAAAWIDFGEINSLDERNILFNGEVPNARYLQVEITLRRGEEAGGAPILRGFTVLGGCAVFFG